MYHDLISTNRWRWRHLLHADHERSRTASLILYVRYSSPASRILLRLRSTECTHSPDREFTTQRPTAYVTSVRPNQQIPAALEHRRKQDVIAGCPRALPRFCVSSGWVGDIPGARRCLHYFDSLGHTLTDALDQMISEGSIDPQLAMKVLSQVSFGRLR